NSIGTGIRSANVHIGGTPQVPNIPGLLSGSTKVSEAYGRTSLTANDFTLSPTGSQGLAVVLLTGGTGSYNDAFSGFSYLFFINASTKLGSSFALDAPRLSVGTGTTVALQNGGWLNNITFGGAGNTTITSLAAGEVYATLVPNGQTNYNVSVTRGATVTTQQLNGGAALTLGTVYYIDTPTSETPSLVVDTPADIVDSADFKTSLREAIAYAAAKTGPDTITFSSLFNSANTITLTGGQFTVNNTTDPLTIQGPGANLLSVNADKKSRVFEIAVGTSTTINGVTITGGASASGSPGGGILNRGTLTVNDSAISGNTATSSFGGGIENYGSLTVNSSIISNNIAGTNGGIDSFNGSLFVMSNTTVTGNSAGAGAGGVYANTASTLTNCTIVGNTGTSVGGINTLTTANLTNSLVAGNTGTTADVAGTVLATNSLIGNSAGATLTGGSAGNLLNVPALLGVLGNYGGTTQTIPLLPGSPAINAGTTASTSDQRGKARVGAVDIGAFESQGFTTSSTGSGQSTLAGTAFAAPLVVTVVPVNAGEPVDGGVFAFAAPVSGASASLSSSTVTISGGAASVTATANATLGKYDVTASANGVGAVTFTLTNAETPSLVVNTDSDASTNFDGKTSLREAIAYANTKAGADTVTFDATFFATPRTIMLSNGVLTLSDTITINGPGASQATVNGNAASRLFNTGTSTVGISGLTLTNGKSTGGGGAILTTGGSLTLTDMNVSGNTATSSRGGAINAPNTNLTILRSTLSGNSSSVSGGGCIDIPAMGAANTILIDSTALSGNWASGSGGAMTLSGAGNVTVQNSTISGNTSGNNGGGIRAYNTFSGTLNVFSSTVSKNTLVGGGLGRGVSQLGGTVNVVSSIVAQNSGGSTATGDLSGSVNVNFSLIGSKDGATITGANNFSGTNTTPLDAKLGALASNGGPTLTHALLAGSPAINNGSNPAGLTTDQRGAGFARNSGGGVDIGAFEIQVASPSKVSMIVVGDGTAQRSRVTQIKLTFDSPVTFVGSPGAAFTLTRQSDSKAVTLAAAVSGNDVTLTFTGGAVDNTSLADGRYTLTALAGQAAGGGLDGDGNGTGGDNYTLIGAPATSTNLFRLFGDADGSGQVTSADFLAFRLAFLSSSQAFDFDGSGTVDSGDFLAFRLRFLQSV
ncbi:MAG: hypothetical protein K1X57_21735, partial [Gemmataceae bacterium]|nr:hypothetical protein [Gemmataceae bacterium]